MTQAVNNNILNNLEQMFSNTENISKSAEKITSGMDKSTNFKNVLENKLDKKSSSIDDLKNKDISSEDNSIKIANFKEILKQTTDEANVETSLDLTLARDITEIISQLKDAVENATKNIEDDSQEVKVDELADIEDLTETDIDLTLETVNVEQNLEENDNSDVGKELPFEQLLTFADKIVDTKINFDSAKEIVKDEVSTISDSINNTSSEIIEFAENMVDEVLVSTKQTSEEPVENQLESILDEEMIKDLQIESLSAETDTTGGENLMQNQTPEEYAVKAMIHTESTTFEGEIDLTQNFEQQTQTNSVEVTSDKLMDQITKHIENLRSGSKVNIVLNPESLGKVNIQLLNTKEGLTAQFVVTTQEAKDMLSKGLDGLKETLASQGVGVENVSVKIADSQKSEYNQDWTEQDGSGGGNKKEQQSNKEEKDKNLFEKMMAQTTEDENGKV